MTVRTTPSALEQMQKLQLSMTPKLITQKPIDKSQWLQNTAAVAGIVGVIWSIARD